MLIIEDSMHLTECSPVHISNYLSGSFCDTIFTEISCKRNLDHLNDHLPCFCSLFLVGDFESDALLVPPKCRFEHMHETTDCQTHDVWHQRASDKCKRDNLTINDYGVLIPCGTGMFTGVEFVCCPPDNARPVTEFKAAEEIKPTTQQTSVLGLLKSEISKLAKYVEPDSVGMLKEITVTVTVK